MKTILLVLILFAHSAFAVDFTQLYKRIDNAAEAGIVPLIVMDLDETTIDSSGRRFISLQQAAREISSQFENESEVFLSQISLPMLRAQKNIYSLSEMLNQFGIKNPEFEKQLSDHMVKIYLS